jgi:hypothetical protein
LAHLSYILAQELRNLTREESWETEKESLTCHATLCEKLDPLNTLGSVANYLRNSQFFRINDTLRRLLIA